MEYADIDGALAGLAAQLHAGRDTRDVLRRERAAREIVGVTSITIRNPLYRVSVNPARRLNPWISLAEFPWLIAGRCDIAWLLPYLPRAAEFSDDGRYWRAGYGLRLRHWGRQHLASVEIDQVQRIVDLLGREPLTRQAVIALWDPTADLGSYSKDVPCTNWLHFQAHGTHRPYSLDLTVVMRSNDLVWGFSGVNAINFTLLQELVSSLCGMRLGVYRHVSSNMHVYADYLERMAPIASAPQLYPLLRRTDERAWQMGPAGGLRQFTGQCKIMLELLEARQLVDPERYHDWSTPTPWLRSWAYFMSLHPWLREDQQPDWWQAALGRVVNPSWCIAAANYLARRSSRFVDVLDDLLRVLGVPIEVRRAHIRVLIESEGIYAAS